MSDVTGVCNHDQIRGMPDGRPLQRVYRGLKTNFNGGVPLKFVFHENGFAEFGTGETESEVEVSAGASTFTIGAKTCKISWPAQTISSELKHMHYVYEGGQCVGEGGFEEEAKSTEREHRQVHRDDRRGNPRRQPGLHGNPVRPRS